MFNQLVSVTLIILSIGFIYLFINQKNNIENFSGDQLSTIKEEINKQYNMDIEAIRNLGAISKSLLTGKNYHSTNTASPGTLTIPGNMKVEGWAVGVPVGTIIMWSMETPPPPNTDKLDTTQNLLSYTDKPENCWFPCVGGTINGVKIPDMRGRMVVGVGATANSTNKVHMFGLGTKDGENTGMILSHTEGELPLRNHDHHIAHGGGHSHTFHRPRGDKNWGGGSGNAWWGGNITQSTHDSGHHNHDAWEKSHNYGTNSYSRKVIPHSIMLHFWIRIR